MVFFVGKRIMTGPLVMPGKEYPFSAYIDREFWKPSMDQNSRYFKNRLIIRASDSVGKNFNMINSTKGKNIDIIVKNPHLGKNIISNFAQGEFMLTERTGGAGHGYFSNKGEVSITELDTINSHLKGTFSAEFTENNKRIEVKEGKFNMALQGMFCPVPFKIVAGSNTLWNKWYLSGIYNHVTKHIDNPPCNSKICFTITKDTTGHEIAKLSINWIQGRNYILNDSVIRFSIIFSTMVGGPDYAIDYDHRISSLCNNQKMVYKIHDNVLELKNSNGDKLMLYR